MEGLEGLFQCSVHNVSFDNIDEFYAHENSVEHHRNIKVICPKCGSGGKHTEFEETDIILPLTSHKNLTIVESLHLCSKCEQKQKDLLEERASARGETQ